jgi:poly(3-hydroxybutyrate) depolymerase
MAMACLSLKQILAVSTLALSLALGGGIANGAEKLGSYPVDAKKVSISGISSGAFMANQFHIAHSALIMGAGMVAGGLYACAVEGIEGDHLRVLLTLATGPCMSWPGGLQRFEVYQARVKEFARRGWIDPVKGLEGDRVYFFTGRSDKVVNPATVHRAAQLYLSLATASEDLKLVDVDRLPGKGAGHSWVTVDYGGPCDANTDPYIDACGYDQAEDILRHIYGELKPRSVSLSGRIIAFSQAEFAPSSKTVENGLAEAGYIYVPKACEPGSSDATCALHVALHGCRQSAELLGEEFYQHIGLNEWADSNNIIVLYPQAHSVSSSDFTKKQVTDLFEINPEGCWNWFGYSYDDRYPLKDGVQVTAIYNMIRRVMGEGRFP